MWTRRLAAVLALAASALFAGCASTELSATATATPATQFLGDGPITLTGVAGPAGDTLVMRWSIAARPDGSTAGIVGDDKASATITPDVAGGYDLVFTVEDPALRTGGGIASRLDGRKPVSATVHVDVAPRPAAKLAFVVQPSNIVAGAPITPAVALEVQNDRGEKVAAATPEVTITLGKPDGSNAALLGTATGTAAASAVSFADLSVDRIGHYTLSATAPGLAPATSDGFDVTAAAPDLGHSTFTATPASARADGVASIALVLAIQDRFGNPAKGVSATIKASGSENDLQTEADGVSNDTGAVPSTLRSTRAEKKTATATFGGLELSSDVTFTPGLPAQDKSSIACAPASAVANGSDPITCVVTLRDAFGNPVPGATAVVGVSGSDNAVSPTSIAASDETGTVTFQVTSTHAEDKAIGVQVGEVTLGAPATFVPGAPDVAHSTFGASPTSVVADGSAASVLTATVRDAFDNAVPGATVTFSVSGSGNTLSDATVTTDAAGMATTSVRSTTAEEKTATATFGDGMSRTATLTFTSGDASATNSTLVASPTTLVADDTATSTITATIHDTNGNPVAGITVAFAASGTLNTLSAPSATTDQNGVASITLKSRRAEEKTITATFGANQTKTTQITFTAGQPVASQSLFSAAPTTVVADGASVSTLTATVKDAYGNAVPGVTVSFSATGSNNTLSAATATTSASGVATVTLKSITAETKTATATFGANQSKTASVTFTAEAAGAANSTLTASPTTVVANDVATSTITATIRDANNNPVPNTVVAFTASGTGNTFGAASATTNSSGVATTTLRSHVAESKTITATFGASLTKVVTVAFTAGDADSTQSTLTASPSTLVADNAATATLTATLKDAFGNAVPGATVNFALTGSGNTLSAPSATTNASGVASVTVRSSIAGVKTATATFGVAATMSTSVTFTAGAPVASLSTLTANPSILAADNTALSTVTATLKDANGNLVPGATVGFTVSGTGNTLSAASATTDQSGVATVTLKSTRAEAKTVTATFGTAQTKTASVTFTAGSPAAGHSTLAANPTSVVANDVASTTVSATIRDANDNPIVGLSVAFASTGSANSFSAPSAVTDTNGVASVALKSHVAEGKTITATFGSGQSLTTPVTFVAGSPDSAQSTYAPNPTSLLADNVSTSSLVATLKDSFGNLVPGATVGFTATGSLNTLSATSATTNASGVAFVTLRSAKAEQKTTTATFSGITKSAPVTFLVGPASAQTSTLTANPTTLLADNVQTSTVTATIYDATNNAVAGASVSFSVSGQGASLSAASATTNASGVATVALKSSLSGAKTVTATFGASQTKQVAVTFTCVDADGDGYGQGCLLGPDCDDERPSVNPGRTEVCQNGLDDDCNSATSDICAVACPPGGCGIGCADGQREGFTDASVFPYIAACSGGFQVAGTFYETPAQCQRQAGDDGPNTTGAGCAAEDLCAQGWHVCKTTAEVRGKVPTACQSGISSSTCGAGFPASTFYVARQSGNGCTYCSTSSDPTHICPGAGGCNTDCYPTSDQTNDLFGGGSTGNGDAANCGPLDRTGGNGCGAMPSPWNCSNSNGYDESLVVVKPGSAGGGVLCCID